MNRQRRLFDSYDLVVRAMNLRPPQAEALKAITDALCRLPDRLSVCSPELTRSFLSMNDEWHHTSHPTFTLALAMGVGKTRLAGAIMALLWLANEARTFMVLAPRRAVLQRFENALNPQFREYIFVDPNLVPEPYVIRSDEIDTPRVADEGSHTTSNGPRIYLLSPQLITSSDRFKNKPEYADKSPAEVIREHKDLVVILDEAHHVGKLSHVEASAWANSIRLLEPRLQLGLTATPRHEDGVNILYEYPLRKALAEGIYTKKVQILVRKFEDSWGSADDIDLVTVDFGLQRLEIKTESIRKISPSSLPPTKPILLIFARDIDHARHVYDWIIGTGRATEEQILLTHSKMSKSEDEIERLLNIEDFDNPVRIVVNVMELSEGWDVTNVYVVAPLRAMATFTGALQAMGRGLRLPAGKRVNEHEVDTLDVVCFGKETLELIIRQATEWSGRQQSLPESLQVKNHSAASTIIVPLMVLPQRTEAISYFELEVRHPEISLNLRPEAFRHLTSVMVHGMELAAARMRIEGVEGKPRLSKDRFVAAATMRVLRQIPKYLSDENHSGPIAENINRWLDQERPSSAWIDFDPIETGEEVAKLLSEGIKRQAADYVNTRNQVRVTFPEFQVEIEMAVSEKGSDTSILSADDMPEFTSPTEFIRRQPYGGWSSSLHPVYTFDSCHEALLARLLDRSPDVDWWVRNQPRRIQIPTPAGSFFPDFVVALASKGSRSKNLLLVEVKGDIYWNPPDSEARLKASATKEWCMAQSNFNSDCNWRFVVALESDIEKAQSWDHLCAIIGDNG